MARKTAKMSTDTNNKPDVIEPIHPGGGNSLSQPMDVFNSLKAQLGEHLKLVEHYKTLAIKTQGAMEVLAQMYPDVVKDES